MRGWAKVGLWAVILLACAGVGAFIASRSNPFPPGVPDPGAVRSDSPSPSPPEPVVWSVELTSRSSHVYRVGGSCRSDWRMSARIAVADSGDVEGDGVARLLRGAGCDFPTAQVQARSVVLSIRGRRLGDELVLRFAEREVRPLGAQDLGGFLRTIRLVRLRLDERAGSRATSTRQIEDPADEVQRSVTTVRLRRPPGA